MPILDKYDDDVDGGSDAEYQPVNIVHSPFSLRSLRVDILDHDKKVIGFATGFIFAQHDLWQELSTKSRLAFVTNYHVVAGQDTSGRFINGCNSMSRPFYLNVRLPAALGMGVGPEALDCIEFPLLQGEPGAFRRRWYSRYKGTKTPGRVMGPEHQDAYPDEVMSDIALLPILDETARIHQLAQRAYVWNPQSIRDSQGQLMVRPTDRVYVLGYPASTTDYSPTMPIWTAGSVANEVNSGREERFLIDSRTRKGQSGSPVISYRRETYVDGNGGLDGTLPEEGRLLGVYSGRTDDESDIGSVWWGSEIEHIHKRIDY
ncbi:trypsin-like peptidase domain-containing protein [Arthrobacter sp. efr-133-R2A-63]|uniref:trypsin-like peptidase domain-containing protein n=1 Tax=Arthrobacter sp. efr-133-R2A-63 TaxID=3040278 RepID=UPI00254B4712|nr:trypsin-like peptidase domain-containing protein [Arthrobacter sp. efr-133-R2A-63]